MFKNKVLLITGGTGSFGNAMVEKILHSEIGEIRIFSRDEKKQDDMRKKYNNKKLTFYIGDVRDYDSVFNAMNNVDFVFHAAALKQVPSCEFFPMEAVKTNVIGTENTIRSAIAQKIKRLILLSTDKAANPISAMGMTKATAEKIASSYSRQLGQSGPTIIMTTRFGNVLGSRGSVVPLFIQQIKDNNEITITNPLMTRFFMTLEKALDLVLYSFEHGEQGDLFVQKAPASSVDTLAKAIIKMTNSNPKITIIGTRHSEKQYEALLTHEEFAIAEEFTEYFKVPLDIRDLNYEAIHDVGDVKFDNADEYNSNNTKQATVEEIITILSDVL